MPTSSEKIVNRPLSGTEVKAYLRSICDRLLDAEGMLAAHIAYGRISGSVKLVLKFENAYFPESSTSIEFAQDDPSAPATGEGDIASQTATFQMDNPNAERVRLDLPVPVETKQLDGTRQVEYIHYPADSVDDLPPAQVQVEDTTAQVKRELGL